MRKISIIIPVIHLDKIEECIRLVRKNSGVKDEQYDIIIEQDTEGIGCPEMVKRMVAKTDNDLICFLGDDSLPQPGFLIEAIKAMLQLPDGWGLVGFNDLSGRQLPTHWLADRRLLSLIDNEFFSTAYGHWYCDNELCDRAVEEGRYIFAPEAIVKHDHEHIDVENNKTLDSWDEVVESPEFQADEQLYYERKRKRMESWPFKLGVGLPILDEKIHLQFFLTFLGMRMPPYTLFTPEFPVGRMTENIATARNSIVSQALSEKVTHLIFCDTDQVYPEDCIEKLLSHDRDIVGVRVHRRWPPFEPIMNRGEIGKLRHVSDEEVFSGDLIEVDSTGFGCMLIRTHVLG